MPAIHPGARGAIITGWGTSLPPKIVTNEDLRESGLDTTDAWIRERTGIGQRHIGGTTAGMSIEAGRQAIERAGVEGLNQAWREPRTLPRRHELTDPQGWLNRVAG